MLRYAVTTLLCGAGLLSSAPSAAATPTPTSPPAPAPAAAPAAASCSACSPDGSYICEGGYCFANGSIVANRERNLLRSFGPGAVFLNRCAAAALVRVVRSLCALRCAVSGSALHGNA